MIAAFFERALGHNSEFENRDFYSLVLSSLVQKKSMVLLCEPRIIS